MARSVAKQNGNNKAMATAEEMPAFMKGHAGEGTESLGQGDVEIPRIKLIQKASPELDEFDDLRPGMFFHTVAETSLILPGQEGDKDQPWKSIRFVPVYMDVRYILWRPRDDGGGGILARADDGIHWEPPDAEFTVKLKNGHEVTWKTARTVKESGLDRWGSEDPRDKTSGPAATQMYNTVCYFPDFPQYSPAVFTFQVTGAKVGRKLAGKLKISEAPSYGMVFELTSKVETNPQGMDYLEPITRGQGFIKDQEIFNKCKDLYELFHEQGLRIRDVEGLGEEVAETGAESEQQNENTEY